MRLASAIVLLVLLAGCTQDKPSKVTGNAVATGDSSICDKIADARSRYECLMQVAVGTDNITLCKMMQTDEWIVDCVTNISIKRKDMTICDVIEAQRSRDDCYKSVQSS